MFGILSQTRPWNQTHAFNIQSTIYKYLQAMRTIASLLFLRDSNFFPRQNRGKLVAVEEDSNHTIVQIISKYVFYYTYEHSICRQCRFSSYKTNNSYRTLNVTSATLIIPEVFQNYQEAH